MPRFLRTASFGGPFFACVAATWRSSWGGGRYQIFNGHVDVVPATPEHHWTRDPWGAEVEGSHVRPGGGGHEERGGRHDLRGARLYP